MVSVALHFRGCTMLVRVLWFYHFVSHLQRIGWSGELSSPQMMLRWEGVCARWLRAAMVEVLRFNPMAQPGIVNCRLGLETAGPDGGQLHRITSRQAHFYSSLWVRWFLSWHKWDSAPACCACFFFFFAVPIVSYSAGQICNLHRIYIHISVFVCMRIVGCFAAHATIVGLSCKGITVGQTFCCCAACWGLLKDFDLPVLVFIVWDNLCWVGVLFVSFFFAVEFVCLFQWRFLFLFFFKAVLNTALPTWQRTTSRRCLWLF